MPPSAPSGLAVARWPHSLDVQVGGGAIDDAGGVGVCSLDWYLNGSYVATTYSASYSFGGLTPSTSYTVGREGAGLP